MENNTAREYLLNKSKTCSQIFIDDAVTETGIDKAVLFEAMKSLEDQEIGKIIVGRRGGRTRFEVGKIKQVSKYAIALTTALENIITQKGCEFIIEADSLTSQFEKKDISSAFKMMEAKGLGVFVIGRKGGKSRFEVGKKKEAKKPSKKKVVQTVDDTDILVVASPLSVKTKDEKETTYKIKIYGDTAFAIVVHDGTSFDEAFETSELRTKVSAKDLEACKIKLLKFGLVKYQ